MEIFGSLKIALWLGVAVIVAAALFRFLPGAPRQRLRRSVILYAFYLGLFASTWVAGRIDGFDTVASILSSASELCELFLIVNLAALLLFDVLLALTRRAWQQAKQRGGGDDGDAKPESNF